MNPASNQALRIALVHERDSVIKQLQTELWREKAAHKRTRDEYESLKDADPHLNDYYVFQCPHCHMWEYMSKPERAFHTVISFKNGTCSSKNITVCSDCDRRGLGYSPWSRDLQNTYIVYKGNQLAAVLIQLAWARYKQGTWDY